MQLVNSIKINFIDSPQAFKLNFWINISYKKQRTFFTLVKFIYPHIRWPRFKKLLASYLIVPLRILRKFQQMRNPRITYKIQIEENKRSGS